MSEIPPPAEWVKGKHGSHDVVVVEVLLRRDAHGRLYSEHHLQANLDLEVVMTWPSGGLEQVAFGLLAEAVRREAILDIVLQISHDPAFVQKWSAAEDDERTSSVDRMAQGLVLAMNQAISRVAHAAILDAVGQVVAAE